MDLSTRLALLTSLCHMKEIGNPSPPWTRQHWFDFLSKARKPFCTSKRYVNANCIAMSAGKDGNLVTGGSTTKKLCLGTLHIVNDGVFPQQDSHAQHLSSSLQRDDAGRPSSSSSWRMAHGQLIQLKSRYLAPTVKCTAWLIKGCCGWFRRASVHLV